MESNSLQVEHLKQEANSLCKIFYTIIGWVAHYESKTVFHGFESIISISAKVWPHASRHELLKKCFY